MSFNSDFTVGTLLRDVSWHFIAVCAYIVLHAAYTYIHIYVRTYVHMQARTHRDITSLDCRLTCY